MIRGYFRGGYNMIEVKCSNPDCDKTVKIYPYRLKETKNFFCSKECRAKFNSRPRKPKITVKCDLEGCENTVTMTENEFKQSKHHFCSKKCHDEFKKNRVKLICDYCGEEYEVPMNRFLRQQENHFCCVEHHNLFMSQKIKTKCDYCGKEYELAPNRYNRSQRHFCCPEHAKLGLKTNRYEMFDDYAELIITSKTYGEIRVKIDKEDVEKCKELTWIISHNKKLHSWYIQNNTWTNGVCKTLPLHRYLMECPKSMEIDHINRQTLDNRKCNLQVVTREQNVENRGVTRRSTTGILNVYKYGKKYQVGVTKNGVRHKVLGIETIEEAKEIAKNLRNTLMTNNMIDKLDNDSQGA